MYQINTTDFKTIHVVGKPFSLDTMESVLQKQTPGRYRIVWKNKTNTWEMKLKWNGQTWKDLYHT